MTIDINEKWNALPEELKKLFKEVRQIDYFAWKSIDNHDEAYAGYSLKICEWPSMFGPLPTKEETSSTISSILQLIQSLDDAKDKIVNGVFKLDYETRTLNKLEENEKIKFLLENEKTFLLRQLQFLFNPAVTFKARKWPKAFGEKPSDFSNLVKMKMLENSLLDRLSKFHQDINSSAKLLNRSKTKVTSTKKKLQTTASKKSTNEETNSTGNTSNKTSSVSSTDDHQGVSKVLMNLNTIIDQDQMKKEQLRLKRFKSRPGCQGKEVIKDIEDEGYLNWNVTDFQHLLLEGAHFNDQTMYTFTNAVRHHYNNSSFYYDKYETYTIKDFDNLVESEKHFMTERTRDFAKIENVCRLMITGTIKLPHYQVVVFVREKNEVTIIDCNTNVDLDKKQIEFIKHIIHNMGWIHLDDPINLLRNNKDEKNDLSDARNWFYNYIKYSKVSQDIVPSTANKKKQSASTISAIAKKKKLSALSGPFSCLVYLHIMSKSDQSFQPELINFDDERSQTSTRLPTAIRLNPESMR